MTQGWSLTISPQNWEKEATIMSYVKCVYGVYWTVKMEHAVFFRIGHANGRLTRSFRLSRAADLLISHIG